MINILHIETWHIYSSTYADALFVLTSNIFCSSWEKSTGSAWSPEDPAQSRVFLCAGEISIIAFQTILGLFHSPTKAQGNGMKATLKRRPGQTFPREVFQGYLRQGVSVSSSSGMHFSLKLLLYLLFKSALPCLSPCEQSLSLFLCVSKLQTYEWCSHMHGFS